MQRRAFTRVIHMVHPNHTGSDGRNGKSVHPNTRVAGLGPRNLSASHDPGLPGVIGILTSHCSGNLPVFNLDTQTLTFFCKKENVFLSHKVQRFCVRWFFFFFFFFFFCFVFFFLFFYFFFFFFFFLFFFFFFYFFFFFFFFIL
jgi:hypothetical protein